jgi:catecholate siderophore receptor
MAHIKSRKHPIARRLNCSAAVALAVMSIPGAVYAQQANDADTKKAETLPQITVQGAAETYKADKVSSPKFTQPLVDTPQTITVIKKELLLDQGATTLTEALRNTPGVTMTMGENGNTTTGDSIFLRGFDTSGSIFIDGIRDLGTITRDVFNIEQVEIVKGPAGTDNGRGAPSGYVNLESKRAKADNFTNATIGARTAGSVRATADLNRQFGENSAFRLNLLSDTGGVEDRDWVKNKSLGIAPSIAFGLNTPTRVVLNFLHMEQRNRPDGGIPAIGLPGYQGAGALAGARSVDRSNFYGSPSDYNDVDANMVTAFIEHDLTSNITIRNTTRAGITDQDYNLTGINGVTAVVPGNPNTWTVSRSRQGKDQRNQIFTNQTNVTAELETGAVKHSLSGGVELIYEKQANRTLAISGGSQDAANLYNPSTSDVFRPLVHTGAGTEGDTTTVATYLFDTIKLNEAFQINGGVRYEHYKTEFTDTTAANVKTRLDGSDNLLTWKVGALYKPAQNGSIYIAYASSEKPPGSDNFSLSASGTSTNNPNVDPQKGTNVELGTKWDLFDNRVSATAAIYRSENSNELVSDGGSPANFTQIGKRRVDGVELGLVGMITPNLNISTGLAYMDSKIVKGTTAQQGGVIVFSPKVTFTSWLTYKLPAVPGLTIGGGARYVDTAARSSNATVPTNLLTIPDYWVADAMASYDLTKNLSLQLNINNLFDKKYFSSLNSGGSRYRPGEERNALLTANLKF